MLPLVNLKYLEVVENKYLEELPDNLNLNYLLIRSQYISSENIYKFNKLKYLRIYNCSYLDISKVPGSGPLEVLFLEYNSEMDANKIVSILPKLKLYSISQIGSNMSLSSKVLINEPNTLSPGVPSGDTATIIDDIITGIIPSEFY